MGLDYINGTNIAITTSHFPSIQLSSTDLAECGKSFELFDKDRDGKCTRRELGLLMRACNQCPSEGDLDKIYEKHGLDDDASTFDLSTFTKIMETESQAKNSSAASELRDQFKVFDRNDDGNIGVSEFRYIMTNLGEKMSDDEINELLADPTLVDPKTGLIQYEKLIKIILS